MKFSPEAIALIVQGLQAMIQAAPTVLEVAKKAKQLITNLFTAKLISKEEQNALHAHVDAVCAAAKAGQLGPEWDVEPD